VHKQYDSSTNTSKATVTCDEGFELVGASEVSCLLGGSWSTTNYTCNPVGENT